MTKYRLKDRDLQAKLDELSGGEFSKNLYLFDDEHFASGWGKNICFTQTEDENGEELEEPRTDKQPQFAVFFNANEVEAVPEYNPHKWNLWPDVTPPEGVLMRVEFIWNDGSPGRCCGKLWNGVWVSSDDLNLEIECVKRFRPWDDTTSTLSKKMLQEIVTALESHPEAYELGYLIDAVDEAANELPDEEEDKE